MAEAISPRKGSDQHRNIIWHINRNGVQILSTPNLCNRGEHLAVITRGTAAVTYGTELYFSVSSYGYQCPEPRLSWMTPRIPHLVFKYNTSEDKCFTLPACEVHDFGLAVVDGLVTVVGGEFDRSRAGAASVDLITPSTSSRLHVLEVRDGSWNVQHFPPMIEPRKHPAVICVQQYVIVAGGVCDCTLFNTVELMDIETKRWFEVASLPEAVSSLTAACCGDQLYFLGGRNKDGSTSSVFTCSVQSLIMSSAFDMGKKLKQGVSKNLEQQANPVWRKAADVPVLRSTCVAINDQLFAVGGRTSRYIPSFD